MRYALKVAYDGTDFCGWQVQPNGYSVQQALSDAAKSAFGEDVIFTASGRTDSGVHALGQVCHADIRTDIPPQRLADALNCHLPQSVSVLASAAAPEGFDANRSAKKKTYRYCVYLSRREHPLMERYAVRSGERPDPARMKACAALLEGEHDFAAFSASGSSVKTTVRTVYSVEVSPWADKFGGRTPGVYIDVCGSGFLYNMVRIMAGAILECGTGKLPLAAAEEALRTGDRELLGKTMPAKGLTLLRAEYGFPLFGRAERE